MKITVGKWNRTQPGNQFFGSTYGCVNLVAILRSKVIQVPFDWKLNSVAYGQGNFGWANCLPNLNWTVVKHSYHRNGKIHSIDRMFWKIRISSCESDKTTSMDLILSKTHIHVNPKNQHNLMDMSTFRNIAYSSWANLFENLLSTLPLGSISIVSLRHSHVHESLHLVKSKMATILPNFHKKIKSFHFLRSNLFLEF